MGCSTYECGGRGGRGAWGGGGPGAGAGGRGARGVGGRFGLRRLGGLGDGRDIVRRRRVLGHVVRREYASPETKRFWLN